MMLTQFVNRSKMPGGADSAFLWHTRPGALQRLTPPWESVQILSSDNEIRDGSVVSLRTRIGPLAVDWQVRHQDLRPGKQFRDVQIHGPFAHWSHLHRFMAEGPDAFQMEDVIDYAPPGGPLGRRVFGPMINARLERLFRYRHTILAHDLAVHRRYPGPPLRILVTGARGLIGSALIPFLSAAGHSVVSLARTEAGGTSSPPFWNPEANQIDLRSVGDLDAVIHLAGESIAQRWSAKTKRKIRASRIGGTRLLCDALRQLSKPPRTLLCASALGYYGDCGDTPVDERQGPGHGFLAEVARDWEAATAPALEAGMRVVHLRSGVVLSGRNGALARLLPAFQCGAGGPVGGGRMYWSWICLEDLLAAIHHTLTRDSIRGPVNVASPNPVTNREFSQVLGHVLHRPAILPLPRIAVKAILGEMGQTVLLTSCRAQPGQLMASGFDFCFGNLETALRHVLGRNSPTALTPPNTA